MYNRNSLLFQKAVSEGRITPQMISDLEQANMLYDGPSPTVERGLEDKLYGIENALEEGNNTVPVLTDIHGRSIWDQYKPENANLQPINNMSPGERAQVMMGARAVAYAAQQEANQHYNSVANQYNNQFGNPFGYNSGYFNTGVANTYNSKVSIPDTMHISYDEVYGEKNPYNKFRNMYNYNNTVKTDMVNNNSSVPCGDGYYYFNPLTFTKSEDVMPFSKEMDDMCNKIITESKNNSNNNNMINPFGMNQYNNQIPGFGNMTYNPYITANPNSIFNGYKYQNGFVSEYQRQQEQEFNNQFNIIKRLCKSAAVYDNTECLDDDRIKKAMRPDIDQSQLNNKSSIISNSAEKIHTCIALFDDDGNIVEKIDPGTKNSFTYNFETPEQNYNRMANIYFNSCPYNIFLNNFILEWNKQFDETRAKFPDNMGVIEFFENCGTLYSDMIMRESYRKYGSYALRSINKDKYEKSISKDRLIYDQSTNNTSSQINGKPDFHLRDMSFPGVFKNDEEYTKQTGISYDHSTGTLNITVPDHIRANHPEILTQSQPIIDNDIARRIKIQSDSLYNQRLEIFKNLVESEKAGATADRRGE